jgi:hypothetical protein
MNHSKIYVIRLTRREVALIVETIVLVEHIRENEKRTDEAKKLKVLIEKILKQASRSEEK